MSNLKKIILLYFCAALLNSCATKPSVNTSYWTDLVASEQFQNEKKTYFERLDGKNFCWGGGVSDFFKSNASTPYKECIYPSSKLVIQTHKGLIFEDRTLGQELRQLKVLQATPEGFVLTSPNNYNAQVIYIHRTEETDVVDGSFLDTGNWTFYVYTGIYRYQTAIGSKTVHSFKKLTKKQTELANKGLQVFNPVLEYWVDNKLWPYLEDFPTPYKNKNSTQ